jgi:hypothetical protein
MSAGESLKMAVLIFVPGPGRRRGVNPGNAVEARDAERGARRESEVVGRRRKIEKEK